MSPDESRTLTGGWKQPCLQAVFSLEFREFIPRISAQLEAGINDLENLETEAAAKNT